jgi:hypothetical protein
MIYDNWRDRLVMLARTRNLEHCIGDDEDYFRECHADEMSPSEVLWELVTS